MRVQVNNATAWTILSALASTLDVPETSVGVVVGQVQDSPGDAFVRTAVAAPSRQQAEYIGVSFDPLRLESALAAQGISALVQMSFNKASEDAGNGSKLAPGQPSTTRDPSLFQSLLPLLALIAIPILLGAACCFVIRRRRQRSMLLPATSDDVVRPVAWGNLVHASAPVVSGRCIYMPMCSAGAPRFWCRSYGFH